MPPVHSKLAPSAARALRRKSNLKAAASPASAAAAAAVAPSQQQVLAARTKHCCLNCGSMFGHALGARNHIRGSLRCRESGLGVAEFDVQYGRRDRMVGGGGAAAVTSSRRHGRGDSDESDSDPQPPQHDDNTGPNPPYYRPHCM